MICNTVTRLCTLCFLEDYVNVVPVHLICGVLGTLFPPLYTQDFGANVGIEVCWQLVGALAIVGLTVAAMTPVFCLMMCCNILRDEAESRNHQRALRVANINTPNYWLGRIFRAHSTLPHLRPGYRTKNVETFLDNVGEEGVIRNEVQNRQDAGEPANVANSSAPVSSCRLQGIKHQETFIANKQRNCNQHAKKIPTNNTISHLAVFGREPSSMNVKQNSSTSNLQDSKTELVQCGTVQENCDSEKTYKFSNVKKDERYPTMFLAKKLSNGSEIMHNTDATLPIGDYTTPTKTDSNSKSETPLMDINNWLSFLKETSSQTSEEDVDQTHEYSTFEMDSLNSEGYTTLEEKGQTFKTNDISKPLSGSPLRTSPCKMKQEKSFIVSPKENIPTSNKGVNLNDINASYSPDNWEKVFLPFYHNSHLSSQKSTSDLNFSSLSTSKTTVTRDKYKSDSGLKSGCSSTYQYISNTEPTVLNNQLEVDVGDKDNAAKHGSKSDISKHIMLLHKMKSKFNSLDNIS